MNFGIVSLRKIHVDEGRKSNEEVLEIDRQLLAHRIGVRAEELVAVQPRICTHGFGNSYWTHAQGSLAIPSDNPDRYIGPGNWKALKLTDRTPSRTNSRLPRYWWLSAPASHYLDLCDGKSVHRDTCIFTVDWQRGSRAFACWFNRSVECSRSRGIASSPNRPADRAATRD
jgi:hypothetical protein